MEPTQGTSDGDDSSPPSQKRPRIKQACEPCRLRKRRCNGALPCNMCIQFDYKCFFEIHSRKRSKIVEHNAHHELSTNSTRPEPAMEDRASPEDFSKMRSMEANSVIAFTRRIGQHLDPSSGPKHGWNLGWNLGSVALREKVPNIPPITDFLDQDQMYSLASLHFDNVHPVLGFLHRDWILEQIRLRWVQPELCKAPDHLFGNLAAWGSLFSDGSFDPVLPDIVTSAKRALESKSMMLPATLADAQSWLLRCLFLRATDHPHAVHTASCVLMHLVEGIGLHQESSDSAFHAPAPDGTLYIETRRRTFWVARMMNTWVSFEYGRTRVHIRGISTQLPTPSEGDYTADYINLYSLSCYLDPERADSKWEDFLRQVEEYDAREHDGIELSRANLGLCGYRRFRLVNPNPSSETINRIIRIGLRGLDAARRLAEKGQPWWHVANVPFSIICLFLAMDVKESLQHIATAMHVLEFVVERFRTASLKETLKTARFLVRLSKKRKDEDSEVLALSLKKDGSDADPPPESMQSPPPVNGDAVLPVQTPVTVSSSEDWSYQLLNNSDLDWNFFLSADMPAFNSFAPDGIM